MFAQYVQQFAAALGGNDFNAVGASARPVLEQARTVPPAELTQAVAYLAPLVGAAAIPMHAALGATTTGALVEYGGQPGPLTRIVLDRLGSSLAATHSFIEFWLEYAGGQQLPARDPLGIAHAVGILAARVGPDRAMPLVSAWRDAPLWAVAAVACLHHADARAQLGDRSSWIAQVDPLHSAAPQFLQLILALRVIDEHVLVLHRPSRRGAMVWVSGVADNFQLQTLLADALIGSGMLVGERPDPRWVTAFRVGPDSTELEHVDDHFHMVDAAGMTVRNEAGPADISAINRSRVLVLDEARYSRHWRAGRRFPITAEVRLERILTQTEVEAWLGYVHAPLE
jgi:hypothetical protein